MRGAAVSARPCHSLLVRHIPPPLTRTVSFSTASHARVHTVGPARPRHSRSQLQTSPHAFSFHCYSRRHLFGFASASPPIQQQLRRRLPFPPSAFYSLVLDVPSYQLFLPYCLRSTLLASTPSTQSFTAQLTLGFTPFTESYTSLVSYSQPSASSSQPQQPYRVHARSLNSTLFNHLASTWEVRPVPSQPHVCDVTFDIEMSVKSALHRAVVSRVFANVAEQQLEAFVRRGQELTTAAVAATGRARRTETANRTATERAEPVNRSVV